MKHYVSQRRYFIDKFLYSNVKYFSGKILDLGGKKNNRRGLFLPPANHNIKWFYLNNDSNTSPDYLSDASKIPSKDEYFDTIIITELLEHAEDPENVLLEAFRVLKKNGKCSITMPFLYRIHQDPVDYQRWTDFKIASVCKKIGFKILVLKPMGGVFSVIHDFWLFSVSRDKKRNLITLINKILYRLFSPFLRLLDNKFSYLENNITTGWEVVVQK